MPKKPIIIISVFCVIALALGYWSGQGKEEVASSSDVKSPEKKEPEFLKEGLVAYYPFNGNAEDESGNGRHGIEFGATITTSPSKADSKGYSFSGESQGILVNDLSSESSMSASVWIYWDGTYDQEGPSNGKTATVLYKGAYNPYPNNAYGIYVAEEHGGKLVGRSDSAGLAAKPAPIPDTHLISNSVMPINKWVHCAMTIDDKTKHACIYINGTLEDSGTFAGTIKISDELFAIGKSPDSDFYDFTGKLDDIRIYNRALSAEEVKALYEFEKVGVKTIEESGNFKIIKGAFNWDEAKNDAVIRGGRLAVLDTAEALAEAIPVINNFPGSLWIGLSDEDQDGMWQWVDGKPLTFANWAPGQPDKNTNTENYVHIYWSAGDSLRRWNDSMINDSNVGRGTGNINNNKGYLLELNTIN